MPIEIFVNEKRMDTDVSLKIAETKQVNDLFGISDRQTSYTSSFKLPKSERNKMLLGMMGYPGSTTLIPYRIHKVSIFRNGIQTVTDGIGYFKDTDENYNLYVYSENIDLFDKLGNDTIADLNLVSINHILNPTNWIASFARTDYIYALADYGKLDDGTIEVNYQVPSLSVAYLWNKIFNEAGFKWKYVGRGGRDDFNPFLTDEWKETFITIDEGFPTEDSDVAPVLKLQISRNKTSQYNQKTINQMGNEIVVQELTGEIIEYIRFKTDLDVDGMHTLTNSTQYNRSRIRAKANGFYRINVLGTFYNLNTDTVAMYIEKDGYNLFTIKEDFPDNESPFNLNQRIYMRAGDEIFFKVVSLPLDNESYYSYEMAVEITLDNSVTSVNFSSYLSKIKKKDFIKDVLNYYGLMFRRKQDTYEFIRIEELLDPTAQYANYDPYADGSVYEDWSYKFHKVTNESTKIGNYAKSNLFKYKYDNSDDTYADSQIKIDDQTLDIETTVVQRIYKSPGRSVTTVSDVQLRQCAFYTKELNDDGTIKKVKENKTEPYFFRVVKKNTSLNYKLAGATGSSTYNGIVPFMSFEGLDFNNVLPNRYAAFSNMVNYGRKYTVELFLTILDIHTLDFFKLKYIKQLGKLFYVNKISGFSGTRLTKVELIQVRSIEKLGQFNDDFNDDFNT